MMKEKMIEMKDRNWRLEFHKGEKHENTQMYNNKRFS